MNKIFWVKCFSAALIIAPLMPVNSINAKAADSYYIAQGIPAYNQYMKLGYDATKARNYSAALFYFKLALKERPGENFATTAVRNIESYIARDRRMARQRRNGLSFVPLNLGAPNRRITAASRGTGCIANNAKSLTALIPEKDAVVTAANYPTMFFYVPQNSGQALEFILQDENEEDIYKLNFKNNNQAGVVSLSVPEEANLPPLQVGKQYHWSLAIICDADDDESNMMVKGTLQRADIEQDLSTELAKAKPEERAALYAASGLWPETLATLAQLRAQKPRDSNVIADWEELLKSVGLEAVAKEPLIPCCTAQE